jgi:hypothetical protein
MHVHMQAADLDQTISIAIRAECRRCRDGAEDSRIEINSQLAGSNERRPGK